MKSTNLQNGISERTLQCLASRKTEGIMSVGSQL